MLFNHNSHTDGQTPFLASSNMPLILLAIVLMFAAEKCSAIPPFLARYCGCQHTVHTHCACRSRRKLVHFCSGLLLVSAQVDSFTWWFILCFTVAVAATNWFMKPLRCAHTIIILLRDCGYKLFCLSMLLGLLSARIRVSCCLHLLSSPGHYSICHSACSPLYSSPTRSLPCSDITLRLRRFIARKLYEVSIVYSYISRCLTTLYHVCVSDSWIPGFLRCFLFHHGSS